MKFLQPFFVFLPSQFQTFSLAHFSQYTPFFRDQIIQISVENEIWVKCKCYTTVQQAARYNRKTSQINQHRVEFGYNMLGKSCVVITEEYNVVFKSEELIGTAEYVTVQARCRINRCRYNGVGCNSKEPVPTSQH